MNTDILTILQHLENKDAITLFFGWLQKMIQELDIEAEMNSFGFTPRTDVMKFSANLNQRRVLSIYKEKEMLFFSLVVDETDVTEIESQVTIHKKEIKVAENSTSILLRINFSELVDAEKQTFLFEKWLNACKSYFSLEKSCLYRNSHSPELYEMAMDKELLNEYLNQIHNKMANSSIQRFTSISQKVIENLKADNHPLGNHNWDNNATKNFAYCSINPTAPIKPFPILHYEILGYPNSIMNFELHPENIANRVDKAQIKVFFTRFNDELLMSDKWPSRNNLCLRFRLPIDLTNISDDEAAIKLTQMAKDMYNKVQEPLVKFLHENNLANKYMSSNNNSTPQSNSDNMPKHPLNQILYGPPGTGKTYNTINEALAIIEGKDAQSFENEDRTELTTRYKKYVEAGQIMFTTFHQSMSYEDFIEGIKPETSDKGQVTYNVKDGIFKLICEKASKKVIINNDNFNELYEVFLLQHKDKLIELKTAKQQLPFDLQVNEKGDCYAIARTEKASKAGFLKQDFQKFILENHSHSEPSYFPPIAQYIKEYIENNNQNYILIIDEINRGNVSQIFGELITLIEDSKRKGESEELEITLPYSKKSFSVPNNLYIIGTMNTADRSVEALDTALRRRFIFKEMPPKPALLSAPYLFWNLMWEYKDLKWEQEPYFSKEKEFFEFFGASQKLRGERYGIWQKMADEKQKNSSQVKSIVEDDFEGINLRKLLEAINQRLSALLSKDHTIGHAYFIGCRTQKDLETVFYQKIIPLLQEYFYGDLSKIQWIIGEDFVKVEDVKTDIFMGNKENLYNLPKKVSFNLLEGETFLLAIKKIYGNDKSI